MEAIEFKTELWGYSKENVCEYIAKMNEEFTEKLMKTLAEQEKEKKELRERINSLERELKEYKRGWYDVSCILSDARKYADNLKEREEASHEKIMAENRKMEAEQARRVRNYQRVIDNMRDQIKEFFESVDDELAKEREYLKTLEETPVEGD